MGLNLSCHFHNFPFNISIIPNNGYQYLFYWAVRKYRKMRKKIFSITLRKCRNLQCPGTVIHNGMTRYTSTSTSTPASAMSCTSTSWMNSSTTTRWKNPTFCCLQGIRHIKLNITNSQVLYTLSDESNFYILWHHVQIMPYKSLII